MTKKGHCLHCSKRSVENCCDLRLSHFSSRKLNIINKKMCLIIFLFRLYSYPAGNSCILENGERCWLILHLQNIPVQLIRTHLITTVSSSFFQVLSQTTTITVRDGLFSVLSRLAVSLVYFYVQHLLCSCLKFGMVLQMNRNFQ